MAWSLHDPCMIPPVSSCLYLESVWFSSYSQSLVLHSPLGLSVMPLQGMTSPISVPCRPQDMGVWYHSWSKVNIWGTASSSHSIGESGGWDLLRVNLRFGYSGSSLPYWLDLSPANLLYRRIFLSLHTWGSHDLSSIQGNKPEIWRLEVVRSDNSAGRILVRNYLYFPYPRKNDVLPLANPHGICWQYPPS